MTPEGKVKARINDLLASYEAGVYRHMPVPAGYGKPTIDYLCCHKGAFFGIEAKAPGEEPTTRQWATIEEITDAGGIVFVIDGVNGGFELLEKWLMKH